MQPSAYFQQRSDLQQGLLGRTHWRLACAMLLAVQELVHVARAPGRLDVMGGIAGLLFCTALLMMLSMP